MEKKENPYVVLGPYSRHDKYGHPLYQGTCKFCPYQSDSHINVITHCRSKHPSMYKKFLKLNDVGNQQISKFIKIKPRKKINQIDTELINDLTNEISKEKYGNLPICKMSESEVHIIELLVDTNMSIHSIEKESFQTVLKSLKTEVHMKKGKARKLILEYSCFLKKSLYYQIWKSKPIISLIIDGGKNNDLSTYVILLQHKNSVLFGKVFHIEDASALNLYQKFRNFIAHIVMAGALVIASCTDNAANVKALSALNDHQFTFGEQSAKIYRIACSIHTTQLILVDLQNSNSNYCSFVSDIATLCTFLKKKEIKTLLYGLIGKKKIPKIQIIKWRCFYDAANFVYKYYEDINNCLVDAKKKGILTINIEQIPLYYKCINLAFEPLAEFITKIEGDGIKLDYVYQASKILKKKWKKLEIDNIFAKDLLKLFKIRWNSTADHDLCRLSYMLTKCGHKHFRLKLLKLQNSLKDPLNCMEDDRVKYQRFIQRINDTKKKFLLVASFYGLREIWSEELFQNYFYNFEYSSRTNFNIEFWQDLIGHNVQITRDKYKLDKFATTAIYILSMAATEAAAERFYSLLKLKFPSSRWSAKPKLINAEMRMLYKLKLKNINIL